MLNSRTLWFQIMKSLTGSIFLKKKNLQNLYLNKQLNIKISTRLNRTRSSDRCRRISTTCVYLMKGQTIKKLGNYHTECWVWFAITETSTLSRNAKNISRVSPLLALRFTAPTTEWKNSMRILPIRIFSISTEEAFFTVFAKRTIKDFLSTITVTN